MLSLFLATAMAVSLLLLALCFIVATYLDTWVQGLGAGVPGGLRRAPGSLLGASDRDGGLRAVPSWGVLRGLPVVWILGAPQGLHCTWSRGAACRGPRRARWSPRSSPGEEGVSQTPDIQECRAERECGKQTKRCGHSLPTVLHTCGLGIL